jgi:glycosyltransferase involved in cell wall biosynthesis
MSYPRISIVTPSYNQAQYLEKTIQSVLDQGYPNLEYIIMDGGSTDGSAEIIRKYEKHLAYWESQKDQGQYHAIQKGFEKSSGEIMAWINSDDVYHSKSLFTVAEIFSTFPEVSWITGNVCFVDEDDRMVRSYNTRKWSKLNVLNGEYVWIQQESTFWKRSLWNKAGGSVNLQLNYAADFELWMRFFRFEKLYTAEALLGAFRIRKSNQKTLELMPAYMEEYHKVVKQEAVSPEDKAALKKIKFYERFAGKIPLIKRQKFLKKSYDDAYDYAPLITFDRDAYRFILKKD